MDEKNKIKVYTASNGAELTISAPSTKQVISATNNKAQYYAEQAKNYRDEAKLHRDNAKFYSEQNSDVTFEYIDLVKAGLENKIAEKQNAGDYALKNEIPINVSELANDAEYVNRAELNGSIQEVVLPSQENCAGMVLMTDGHQEYWTGLNTFQLFDTKLSDFILTGEQEKGWALQGTQVYKEAIAGSRYGYPDFYNKCLEEKEAGTAFEVTLGDSTITMYVNSNGHQFYDVADKEAVDVWFETYGMAWFYGVDTENECVFLPRNSWFDQATDDGSEVGAEIRAGLPNITGEFQASYQVWADALGGAFTEKVINTTGIASGGLGSHGSTYYFDASRSNSIYGNSSTVQPNAVKKLLYICVGNTTNYEGVTDVVNQGMEILEQVNLGIESRVNLDATNLSVEGKALIAGYGIPDYDARVTISLTAGVKTKWTAPVDCFVCLRSEATGNCSVVIRDEDGVTEINRQDALGTHSKILTAYAYMSKGYPVYLESTGSKASAYYAPLKGAI